MTVGTAVAVRVGEGTAVAVATDGDTPAVPASGPGVASGEVCSPEQAARIVIAAIEITKSLTTTPSNTESR